MKRNTKQKSWTTMTAKELKAATKQFDRETPFQNTSPLSPVQRAQWEKATRGPIYSLRIYNGKQRTIRIRVDDALLRQFDDFARRNRMTREEFIARSFRSAVAFVD